MRRQASPPGKSRIRVVHEYQGDVVVVIGTWNLENLYRPGGQFGPRDQVTYQAKLAVLRTTIAAAQVDVLAVQEVGQPEALQDLAAELGADWQCELSEHPDGRGIRVGFLSRYPLTDIGQVVDFPPGLGPVQAGDPPAEPTTKMGRGALVVTVEPALSWQVQLLTCYLKSKLLTYPGGRFTPTDEDERARYGAYALYRRTAEATTVRAAADQLLDGHGQQRPLIILGDLNDEVQAATTQLLLGPPGSEIGTPGYNQPDTGDAWRLWNLAPLLPDGERYSRINHGRPELIDHLLVSHALLNKVVSVHSLVHRNGNTMLPSITGNPMSRRNASGSDHAPVLATLTP